MRSYGQRLKKYMALMMMLACILQAVSLKAFAASFPDDETVREEEQALEEEQTSGEDQAEEDADHNYILPDDYANGFSMEQNFEDVRMIRYSFLDTGGRANTWSFPYSDSFFRIRPDGFSYTFAQGSMGLAASTARSKPKVVKLQYKTFLTKAGFTKLYHFGYGKPTTADTLSGVIGMKKIDDFTVIAVATCGQGYKNEWAGNMKVGKGVRHQGFDEASQKLEKHIAKYIKRHKIKGKKKLWVTGISRAAAIGNLTAADAIESGEYEDVYAYLFGVPRTTKEPVKYAGIYNICGQYDPVAAIPFETWGFERYGTDMYTPAQESDADFVEYVFSAVEVGDLLDGKGFRNNPEVNYQIRIILEWLGGFFEDAGDYTDRAQPLLMRAVLNHGEDEIFEILTEAFAKLSPRNNQEKVAIKTFINYISYIVGQHARADIRQVDDGSWDPTESTAANFVLEHRPSTYIRWLFSDATIDDALRVPLSTRRLTVDGDVNVIVYRDGIGLTKIDNRGHISAPDTKADPACSGERGVFVMRNGSQTIVSLPDNAEYKVALEATGDKQISYYDVIVSPDKLITESGKVHMGMIQNGAISFLVTPGKPLPKRPEQEMGDYDSYGTTALSYSPTTIMQDELNATKYSHVSLERIYVLLTSTINGVILLLTVCLIIWIVHRRGIKKGRGPYSKWYVIVPHLILIAGFAGLTQFFTFFLYSVKGLRVIAATATMVMLFLLALRGAFRSRRIECYITPVIYLMFVLVIFYYYHSFRIDNYSILNAVLFFSGTLVLTVFAVYAFYTKEEAYAMAEKRKLRMEKLKAAKTSKASKENDKSVAKE